jgi:site-specific DNA-methyltransferase (adenine-specific)
MEDTERLKQMDRLALDYRSTAVGRSLILHADCFEWLGRIPEGSLHAIVTDPPSG